jgi:hypothetical protein
MMSSGRLLLLAGAIFASLGQGSGFAQPPAKPPELKVLDRYLGTWKIEGVLKPAEWTPKERRVTATTTNEWVLNGWFQYHKVKDGDGNESIDILTYDPHKKTHRIWSFFSDGFSVEETGTWDDASKTLTSKADLGEGITVVSTMRFVDNDNRELTRVARDAKGKVYLDIRSKLTRQK